MLLVMAFRRALVLLAGMSSISCGVVYDFDDYQAARGAGGGGQGGDGGGQGGSGGSGGAGGSGSCEGVDLMKDPQNCGGCGVDCAGGECTGGFCRSVTMDLKTQGKQVASLGDLVFVIRGDTLTGLGDLVTYPVEFLSDSMPQVVSEVCDSAGFMSATPTRVYYRAQNGGQICNKDMPAVMSQYVYACDATPSCVKTAHNVPEHINGVAVVEGSFYFTVPSMPSELRVTSLTSDGVPSNMESTIQVPSMDMTMDGAYLLSYDPDRKALWWTTFKGCVFRADIQTLPLMTAPCFTQSVPSAGLLVISPSKQFYVSSVVNEVGKGIYKLDPDAMMPSMATLLEGTSELSLLAADSDYIYAFDNANPGLVALRHDSAKERARIPLPGAVGLGGIDVLNSKYVFFTEGKSLYRWRKPSP